MQPSQMTDSDLNQAIAEVLGYKSDRNEGIWFKKPDDDGSRIHVSAMTNYSGDNNAATKILCDSKYRYQITNERVTIWAPMKPDSENMVKTLRIDVEHDNTPEGIAHAICEAWLQARSKNA